MKGGEMRVVTYSMTAVHYCSEHSTVQCVLKTVQLEDPGLTGTRSCHLLTAMTSLWMLIADLV